MSSLARCSLVALLALGACSDRSPSMLEPSQQPSMSVGTLVYSSTRKMVASVVVPGVVDSKGVLKKAPVGMVFNLGSATAGTYFKTIAARTRANASNGQFFAPPSTDPSYANTQKILTKLGATTGKAVTIGGATVNVATVSPSTWWSATAGKPPATQKTFGSGVTPSSTNATLYYKDSNGTVYKAYFTFAYSSSAIASAPGASDAVRGKAIPWHDVMRGRFASLRTSARFTRAATTLRELLVPTFLWPTVAHAQVATNEAMPADGEFKVVNGTSAGTGKRWSGTCLPGADYASGSFTLLSEIPGTSATIVGTKALTAFSTVLADETYAYCSL